MDYPRQQKNDGGVLFSYANFQNILKLKWTLIKVKRLESIYEGVALGCSVDPKWMEFESELRKYYGPMDTESLQFKKMLVAFQMQRWEMIIKMFEEENKILERMLKEKRVPSEFPQQVAALRKRGSVIETWILALSKLHCDQNPYTNPDNMDFWVMPRPQRTFADYGVVNGRTGNFLGLDLLLNRTGKWQHLDQVLDPKDQNQMFMRKGYNAAVFDVGWHYSPIKAFYDLGNYSARRNRDRNNFDEKKWEIRFLEMRGDLIKFNPFGVEATNFYKLLRNKYQIREDESIFGNFVDQNCLSDLVFPQVLLNNGHGANKIILFDSHFEGVIVTPVEMLLRIWNRIRFLIDQRPNQLLPLNRLQRIYENCFGQKLFPLQWGFKDVEDFVQNVPKYLPKEITEGVTIVTEDELEPGKIDADAGKQKELDADARIIKEIDAKWAEVLDNDKDDGDDIELYNFDLDELYEELVHEGPWLEEGDVYRVVDHND